jgi:aminotransferase
MKTKCEFNIVPSNAFERLPVHFFQQIIRNATIMKESGADVINLSTGNHDLPTPIHIVKKLQQEAELSENHRYPPFEGYSFLKEAVAKRYWEDYKVHLDPETEVAVIPGGKTGIIGLCQCLLNQGDACIVPDPGYTDYWSGIDLTGGEMISLPLNKDLNYLPDLDLISHEQAKRSKLMFVNYPNNPTGAVATPEFYDRLIEFALQHNIVIASDFAYGPIVFDGLKAESFLKHPRAKEVGVEIYTLSKIYNMAGWRVGFIIGNSKIVNMINKFQNHQYCGIFGPVQKAACEALLGPQDCVQDLVSLYQTRRDIFYNALHSINCEAIPSKGSFFCWIPIPKGFSSMRFSEILLNKVHVVTVPGSGFGISGEGFVRFSLVTPDKLLEEAVHRIDKLHLY